MDARLRQPLPRPNQPLQRPKGSLRGVVLAGSRGRLAIPCRSQFGGYLGPLRRRYRGLFAIRRQIVNWKVGAGFLRTRRRVGGRADQRQIRNRCRAAAERQRRRQQQRAQGQCPPFSIQRHRRRESPLREGKLLQPPDAYFIRPCCGSNHCRPKRLKPEHQTEPLGLQYDRTKILCRSAIRPMPRLTSNLPSSISAVTNSK
jgi:hypothetical protein